MTNEIAARREYHILSTSFILCMAIFDAVPIAQHYSLAYGIAFCAIAWLVLLMTHRKFVAAITPNRSISDDLRVCIAGAGILACAVVTMLWVTTTNIALGWY